MREVLTCSHWGTYWVLVENNEIRGIRPFEADCNPSPLIGTLPQTVDSPLRVTLPMVRAGYLRHGPDLGGSGRGR